MVEARVKVTNAVGLHARPASLFIREAAKKACRISVETSGKVADGKSIIQVLALGVKCGQEIVIRAEGEGEAEAVAALVTVVNTPA